MAKKKLTKAQKKTADDLWEYTKQANMQSDNIEMGAMSSDGIQNTGDFTYSFADLDDDFDSLNVNTVSTGFTVDGLTFHNEEELRKKYPALQDAWDHYKNVKHMCEQKEKEDEV
jgi:hypothetical protein